MEPLPKTAEPRINLQAEANLASQRPPDGAGEARLRHMNSNGDARLQPLRPRTKTSYWIDLSFGRPSFS
jgi:hypothetical protein